MQTFQNIYSNVAFSLLGIVTAIVLLLLLLAWRNPVLFKLGLRNIPRRPAQSVLIVIGLTLSTVIIVASFVTGDTLNNSVKRQAVAAYGEIDEILAPPLLSAFATMGAGSEASAEAEETFANLTEGGLTSVLTLLEGGLPGISTDRLAQLKQEAADDPLIDGVAGSILFPTIIRNSSTGQGEPIGFIFAVDDDYDRQFGLNSIAGEALEVEQLSSGVGNVFLQASNLFGAVGALGERAGLNLSASSIAAAAGAIGLVLADVQEGALLSTTIELETLQGLGIDTTVLEEQGITELNVGELVKSVPGLEELITSMGASLAPTAVPTATATSPATVTPGLTAAAPLTVTPMPGATAVPMVAATPALTATPAIVASSVNTGVTTTVDAAQGGVMGALSGWLDQGSELLSNFNLATLGSDLDGALAQVGLQVRQGDVYLNRLGAEQLGAQPGDMLELFIGPVPVPFRVAGIVEQASPVGTLLPVVVMRLDEAQKLLFMNGKVNNVLVSNQGDMLAGVAHTQEVSNRLRQLAMDPVALDATWEILRRPEVSSAIQASVAEGFSGIVGEDVPPFIENLMGRFVSLDEQFAGIVDLSEGLDAEEMSDEVRAALATTDVRSWVLGLELSRSVRDELVATMGDLNQFDVIDPLNKETVLLAANIGGTAFSSLFSVFGFFSVIAGIMLIFLIYVMLAAERRSEMGIARAVGVQRGHVVQMFVSEGMVYSLAAAALGVLIGLGVSYAMIEYLGNIINNVAGQLTTSSTGILEFSFRASPWSIMISYSLGVLLTFIVVVLSSWRVSRLNIVAAIRNLPDESNAQPRTWAGAIGRWIAPLLLLALGGLIVYYGFRWTVWSVVLVGVTLLLFGVMQVVGRLLELAHLRSETAGRVVYTIVGLGLLALWVVPWHRVLPTIGLERFAGDPTQILAVFAIGGPMIITGAIMAIMFNATFFTWLIGLIFGRIGSLAPVLKTAIAYPLSTRFRTGMAMVLFAMIMATVVVMGIVIQATQSLIVLDDRESGGFTIRTSDTLLSFFDPITDMEQEIAQAQARYPLLAQVEHVGAVSTMEVEVQIARVAGAESEPDSFGFEELLGMTPGYIQQVSQVYGLTRRAAGFADDAAVWEALRTRDDVALVRESLVADADFVPGAPRPTPVPTVVMGINVEEGGSRFYAPFMITGLPPGETLPDLWLDLTTGRGMDDAPNTRRVQVIGVLEEGAMLHGEAIQVNIAAMNALLGEPADLGNHYLTVQPGADVKEVAMEVERAFLGSGVNAAVMAETFAQGQAFTRNILRLLQGFMALGLLVGIAGLGVITTRTVVERRQQVGMLRAVGFQATAVAASFVLEASFIAITGLVIGALTGIVLGMNMVRVAFTGAEAFVLPWGAILFVTLMAYGFALLTTIVPAWQASRIYPAEALRYE